MTATRSGADVSIVIQGTGEWYVNTVFNMKLTLGKVVRRTKHAKFEKKNGADKAKRAVFTVRDAAARGVIKAVFCNATSCTPPLKAKFAVK